MRNIRARTTHAEIGRLTAVIARRMRAIADGISRPMRRASPAAAQLPLHQQIYGLSVSHTASSGSAKQRPNKFDSAEHDAAAEVYLPIGPSCC
jgi:hypothetical protein